MAKYRVNFSGYAFIEADNEEEAEWRFWNDSSECYQQCDIDTICYQQCDIDTIQQCDMDV